MDVRQISSLREILPEHWNSLESPDYPFLKHQFLYGLEKYKCLEDHGWYPCHFIIEQGNNLLGAIPLYLKTNSTGEFVFDWDWADAYEQAGGQYYPKLVTAVPYTPVTGPRLLVRRGIDRNMIFRLLYDHICNFAKKLNVSGYHVLFPDEPDMKILEDGNMLPRLGVQYHWENDGYSDFNDFLSGLSSKKRKQVKKERKVLSSENITVEILEGPEIDDNHWTAFHHFYQSTFYRKWGEPRFTLEFLKSLGRDLPDSPVLFMARSGKEYIAGALAFRGGNTLYGRHWGCCQNYKFLHFELCFYQTIDYCIQKGIRKFDAGAQGEHKIKRGFVPVETFSAHWINNETFRSAINSYLIHENHAIKSYIHELSKHLAYRAA